MTGDLAVLPRPAMVERTPSAPAASQRPTRGATIAGPSVDPRSTAGPERSSTEELGAARLRALLADPAVRVRAHRDDDSARVVLQVLDRATGEVIEQYPPDQLLRLYAALRQSLGALVDECA
jgi:uncharacterized FlaG/YvyC family protein